MLLVKEKTEAGSKVEVLLDCDVCVSKEEDDEDVVDVAVYELSIDEVDSDADTTFSVVVRTSESASVTSLTRVVVYQCVSTRTLGGAIVLVITA